MKSNKRTKVEIDKSSKDQKSSRREFFKTAWKGLGVIAGLEFVGLTLHYLADRNEVNTNNNLFEVGIPKEFPKGTVTPFREGKLYLIRLHDGGFLAMSIKCSHLGCSVIWDEKINEFICPCHSSKFNINGDVINPPAPRALDIYAIQMNDGKMFVNLNKKIKRSEFENSQLFYI